MLRPVTDATHIRLAGTQCVGSQPWQQHVGRTIIASHPDNLGCADSWNLVLRLGAFLQAPYTIVSNSDVWFLPGQ